MRSTTDSFESGHSPLISKETTVAIFASLAAIAFGLFFYRLGFLSARTAFIVTASFALVNLLTLRLSFYLVRRRENDLRQQREFLQGLNQISHGLILPQPVATAAETAAQQIVRTFRLSGAAIYLVNEQDQALRLQAAAGDVTLNEPGHDCDALAQLARQAKKPVRGALPPQRAGHGSRQQSAQWALGAPILSGSEASGAIVISHRQPPALAGEMAELLLLVGRQLGIYLQRAQEWQRLQSEQQSLAQRIEDSIDAIWVLDAQGRIAQFNRSAGDLTGCAPTDVIGRAWTEFVPLEGQEEFQRRLDAVMDGERQIWESDWQHCDRSWLRLELGATRLSDNAAVPGVQLMARDVGARTAAQRMRTEFMAAVSHELRTPLSSVMGYAELLTTGMAGDMTEEQQEYADIILRNTQRMQRLVNDLLEGSKLEAGQLELTPEALDLNGLIRIVCDSLKPLMQNQSMTVQLELAPDLPTVIGDQPRLEQVLTNLLINALKYSPSGGVLRVLSYRHAPDADPLGLRLDLPSHAVGWAIAAVMDQGIGIPAEEVPGLFHRFHRGNHARARGVEGTGLGLYLARTIVEALDGHIGVHSQIGSGSIFWIALALS